LDDKAAAQSATRLAGAAFAEERPQMTMPPIRVYLDTSDYAVMYRAPPNEPAARIRDKLLQMKENDQIEIGLSYHVVFEFLQKAEPKYRADRLARAKLLTQLCERNAFPYPTDLPRGYGFSREGLWVPRIWLEEIEIECIVQRAMETMARCPALSRHDRRAVSKRNFFIEWVRNNKRTFLHLFSDPWPLLFGREFHESGDFTRYILGEITREEANKKVRFYITDPMTAYETWFEKYGRENPVPERRDPIANLLVTMTDGLNEMLEEHADLKTKIRKTMKASGDNTLDSADREVFLNMKRELGAFRAEITSPSEMAKHPSWIEAVGEEGALLAAEIFQALHKEKREIKASDAIDLHHVMYLPYADLWRGDKAFSSLLIKNRVKIHERVVPSLWDLPRRIETEIVFRSAQKRADCSPAPGSASPPTNTEALPSAHRP
jgi:hypothetical protein